MRFAIESSSYGSIMLKRTLIGEGTDLAGRG